MKTEKVKLSQVRVNNNNPRTIREQKLNLLVERLLVFPKMISIRPVVVDAKMVVLGGNMRVTALNRIAGMTFEQIAAIIGKTKNYQRLTKSEQEQLLAAWQEWLEKPTVEIVKASELSEAEKKEFIIADNAS
ncbi:MAG: site-specific DNA-methyltransferase, partial [Paludibacteraceae bacterium]|nr:site-specific DNA-methyltransferase [Paludibacteraceae bacterium]